MGTAQTTRVVTREGKRVTAADPVDWVKRARERLAATEDLWWGSVSDEEALKLCTAKKSEMLEVV